MTHALKLVYLAFSYYPYNITMTCTYCCEFTYLDEKMRDAGTIMNNKAQTRQPEQIFLVRCKKCYNFPKDKKDYLQ